LAVLHLLLEIEGGPEIVGQNQGLYWNCHKDKKSSDKRIINVSQKTHPSGVSIHLIINFEK